MRKIMVLVVGMLFLGAMVWSEETQPNTQFTIGSTPPGGTPVKELSMTAQKYRYEPAEVVVEPGTELVITLKALDRSHGFHIDGFDPCLEVDPKKGPITIHFYTEKAGSYQFKCCHFCGFGHGRMKGTITIKGK